MNLRMTLLFVLGSVIGFPLAAAGQNRAWLREQARGATPRVAFTAGRLAGFDAAAREDARRAWPEAWAKLRRSRSRFWE